MSQMLSTVSEQLLAPGGLTLDSLQAVLGELAGPGIDAADLYFQGQISETWALEDGIVKEGSFNLDQGVGVRAQSGEKTGFAYSNAINLEAARTKHIVSPVAGQADILVVPDIEAGNMLAKQLQYLAGADSAGIVLGTRVPIVLTSRADSVRMRLASTAVLKLLAHARSQAATAQVA